MRKSFGAALLAAALGTLASCHRGTDAGTSFVQSLRCGMPPATVKRLALQHGYDPSDPAWLTRSAGRRNGKERILADLRFREGRLVGVREGTWDPRRKQIDYREIDLCSPAP